jgi:FtsP/CotA-like multicopper oxidase with cupredoxin domain
MRRAVRLTVLACAAALPVTAGGWTWAQSRLPGTYSVMSMGVPDYGGSPATAATKPVSVTALRGPTGTPDVAVTLTARREQSRYTLNHTSPGPVIRARQGDLVAVTLVNESVAGGVSLHWHGVDVPNGEDGVAGVTQDAVAIGGRFEYRFRAVDAGTYWYHSHQRSHEQVPGGLFGLLVVSAQDTDVIAAIHTYDGVRTIDGHKGQWRVPAAPGAAVRVRLANTDETSVIVRPSGAFRVLAIDGHDVNGPTDVTGRTVAIAAGGRVDFGFTVPVSGVVRVDVDQATLVIGDGPPPAPAAAAAKVDFLSYGTPATLGFDPALANRRFEYRIGRSLGLLDGVPGNWWTVNGRKYPDVPMFVVSEGDIVQMTITNDSGEAHPMHLHGHHAVVLSRDGIPATGSPWWTDSVDVDNGHSYVVAFRADNPGIWVDHCHNLAHASEGLLVHLMYAGVTSPYSVGGPAGNHPE